MIVRLSTVRFDGAGHLDCRKCSRRTTFPDGAWLVVYDYGATQVVRSAYTGATLHQCGRDFFWQCDDCGEEPDMVLLARQLRGYGSHKRAKRALSCVCGGSYVQHRLPAVDDQAHEVLVAASPF